MDDTDRAGSSADAGRGARDQAERAARRAARLRAELEQAERQHRNWAAGAEGERRVAAVLRAQCWPALHDQRWPGRPKANLDHLALSPAVVWVIDAKHWSGAVTISRGMLRQGGYPRDRAIAGAKAAADDVAAALGPGGPRVRPLVCLTSSGAGLRPASVDGVMVVGVDHLALALGPGPQQYEAMPGLVERVRRSLARQPHPIPVVRQSHPVPPPLPVPQRALPARFLLGLLILAALWWAGNNLDVVTQTLAPLTQWYVDQAVAPMAPRSDD
jgi:hypothetical protein